MAKPLEVRTVQTVNSQYQPHSEEAQHTTTFAKGRVAITLPQSWHKSLKSVTVLVILAAVVIVASLFVSTELWVAFAAAAAGWAAWKTSTAVQSLTPEQKAGSMDFCLTPNETGQLQWALTNPGDGPVYKAKALIVFTDKDGVDHPFSVAGITLPEKSTVFYTPPLAAQENYNALTGSGAYTQVSLTGSYRDAKDKLHSVNVQHFI